MWIGKSWRILSIKAFYANWNIKYLETNDHRTQLHNININTRKKEEKKR